MKLYDISNELFTANVYPGDPEPEFHPVQRIAGGAACNLTDLRLGTHNGTHMDAPYHFYEDGRTIDQLDLGKCVGPCTLIEHEGEFTRKDVESLAASCQKKLLIKGGTLITADAANALAEYGFEFLGVEGLTVGPLNAPMEVHLILLHPGAEIVIAENLNLSEVPAGDYFLVSVPLKLGGLDGAPCRPILLSGL